MGYQEEELARLNAQNRLNQNAAGTGANLNISGISDTTDTELKRINQGYQQGQNVLQAKQQLDNIIAGKPGDYKSSYTDNLNNLYNSIMNRGNFQYDPTADALYQNYKNLYQQNGQKAMRDTNAQASAMTGGYGNSYAAAAGNQAYQGYMQQLNAAIPQLEQQAYQRWQDEGNELYNRMNLTQGMDDREYGRWGDNYNRWYNERGYYDQAYNTERDRDYQQFINDANYWTGIADRENQNALQAQQMKDDAYNYALNLMQYGVMPDEGTLASAGLTPAMAEQIMKQIYTPAGGGYGNGNGNGDDIGPIETLLRAEQIREKETVRDALEKALKGKTTTGKLPETSPVQTMTDLISGVKPAKSMEEWLKQQLNKGGQ